MRRTTMIAMTALVVLAGTVVAGPRVGADEIADRQAQAERISAELAELDTTMALLGEEYNQARLELDQVQIEIDAVTKRLEAANRELDLRRAELADYAVAAFMTGGDSGVAGVLLTGSGDAVSRQIEYLEVASDNRRQIIELVGTAQAAADAELGSLEETRTAAEALERDLDQKRAATQQASSEQQALLAGVTDELLQLVAEAQERQAAVAEREAKARLLGPTTDESTGTPVTAGDPGAPTSPDPSGPGDPSSPTTGPPPPPPTSPPTTVRPTPLPPIRPDPPPPLSAAARAVELARTQLGVPYLWAGDNPQDGFDCSGLIMWAYRGAGKSLPHSSQLMAQVTRRIAFTELLPGDLVFYGTPIHHVGMYVGNGQMIEAPYTGAVVRIAGIWRSDLVSAGRVV